MSNDVLTKSVTPKILVVIIAYAPVSLKINNSATCPKSVFMGFVW
jgi:hypothetical protein